MGNLAIACGPSVRAGLFDADVYMKD